MAHLAPVPTVYTEGVHGSCTSGDAGDEQRVLHRPQDRVAATRGVGCPRCPHGGRWYATTVYTVATKARRRPRASTDSAWSMGGAEVRVPAQLRRRALLQPDTELARRAPPAQRRRPSSPYRPSRERSGHCRRTRHRTHNALGRLAWLALRPHASNAGAVDTKEGFESRTSDCSSVSASGADFAALLTPGRPVFPALLRHRPRTRPGRRRRCPHPALAQRTHRGRQPQDQTAQAPDLRPGRFPAPPSSASCSADTPPNTAIDMDPGQVLGSRP